MTRLAVAVLALSAAPALTADDPKTKKAAEALQGEWKVVSYSTAGRTDPPEQSAKDKVVVAGDQLTVTREGDSSGVAFTLDPKAPAAIDLGPTDGRKGFLFRGIHKLEKDTLTICFGVDGAARPKEYKADKGVTLMVLQRAKK